MPSKEELIQSIHSNMKLDKEFFLKIYGYEISFPGFSEIAISKLELYGCSKARAYYTKIVDEYEDRRLNGYMDQDGNKHEGLKGVARWYVGECEKRYEIYKKKQQGKVVRNWQNNIQDMSSQELLTLLANLTKEE